MKLENDDIQDFDLRWEQALLLTSDLPSDKVWEGLYVSSCKIPPKLRQLWHYIIKKFCEEEENEIISDQEFVWNCKLNKLKEVTISGIRARSQSVWP